MMPQMTAMRRTLTASLSAVAFVCALLMGCSPEDTAVSEATTPNPTRSATQPGLAELPAATIAQRAEAALRGVRSVRIHGSGVDGKDFVALDVGILRSGGAAGSIALNGVGAKLIVVGKIAYLRPSDRMVRESVPKSDQKAAMKALRGHWIKMSMTDRDAADFVALTHLTGIADLIFKDVAAGKLQKSGPKTVNGVRCIGLSNRAAVLWVDVRNARPIRLEEKGSGAFDLSRYDAVPGPKAPPSRLVIDPDQLER